MRFVKFTDYGNAPEIPVDNIGQLEFPSPGVLRISYVTMHQTDDGVEYRLAVSLRWDRSVWKALREILIKLEDAGDALAIRSDAAIDRVH